jgi:hypothetical protein
MAEGSMITSFFSMFAAEEYTSDSDHLKDIIKELRLHTQVEEKDIFQLQPEMNGLSQEQVFVISSGLFN